MLLIASKVQLPVKGFVEKNHLFVCAPKVWSWHLESAVVPEYCLQKLPLSPVGQSRNVWDSESVFPSLLNLISSTGKKQKQTKKPA